jgi:hypothetical protein
MVLKVWLKTQLENLVGVQRCALHTANSVGSRVREPDITVYMWTGIRIHLYILTEELKTRTLKTVIQSDTAIGVASLFIVAPHLLPDHNQLLIPPEWLMAIHALTNDHIYTYNLDEPEPYLWQIHFDQAGHTEQRRVVHGPAFTIGQIRYSRVTLKPRYIKGFWMIADFGTAAFWKSDAQHYQPPPRRQYSRAENPQPGAGRTYANQPGQPPPSAKSRLEQSFELLGLKTSASREDVRTAFRKLAFEVHPDVSQLAKDEAEARFKRLSEAYEYIKSSKKW